MNKYQIAFITTLLIVGGPLPAYAHGEDILVSIGVELLLAVSILVYILIAKDSTKRKIIYSLLIITAAVIADMITANIPYRENKALINTLVWGIPVLTFLAIVILKKKRQKRT